MYFSDNSVDKEPEEETIHRKEKKPLDPPQPVHCYKNESGQQVRVFASVKGIFDPYWVLRFPRKPL